MGFLITLIDIAFEVYMALMFGRILLSWVKHNPYQPIIKFIYEITEPVLGFFRKIIPPLGVIDISPMAAFLVLGLLKSLIINVLVRF
ncbi:MAG: YGGT family protein [Peptococcaceae bacterium BRH_c4a]|nr:MAG: YGGT family protein [Peptococcaceae bacterium BRH_c4a]